MKSKDKPAFLKIFIHIIFIRPFIRLFFGLNVYGNENLSHLDRFIIVSNHNSHLDTLILFSILPVHQILRTHPVAAGDYFFKRPKLTACLRFLLNPVFIKRGEKSRDKNPLEKITALLEKDQNLIIFPEGTRGEPGQLKHFQSGIGRIASCFNHIPILPIYISGTDKSLPRNSRMPLPLWNEVLIGPPQSFAPTVNHHDISRSLESILRHISEAESVSRHSRHRKKPQPTTIAILGIDGSGKSTISNKLAHSLSVNCKTIQVGDGLKAYENKNESQIQPLMTEKIRNRVSLYAKQAKSLKHYKIPKLIELFLRDHLLQEIERWYKPEMLVLDGSPLLNLTAWAILYKKTQFDEQMCLKAMKVLTSSEQTVSDDDSIFIEFPELRALKNLNLNHMSLPDFVFFLDVEPGVALKRIYSRGETVQAHEQEDKLKKLQTSYRMVCQVIQNKFNIPTYTLEGDRPADEILSSAVKIFQEESLHAKSGN